MFDAVVVGGGAAGMMAAITAAERGKHVLLLEKNAQLGRKIRITGKGRCNVTNNCEPRTVIAVSYTHLDVYKRQRWTRATRSIRRR